MTGPATPPATSAPPPSYTASIQQKVYTNGGGASGKPAAPLPGTLSGNPAPAVNVPTTEPPSYASTMQAKAKAQRGITTYLSKIIFNFDGVTPKSADLTVEHKCVHK